MIQAHSVSQSGVTVIAAISITFSALSCAAGLVRRLLLLGVAKVAGGLDAATASAPTSPTTDTVGAANKAAFQQLSVATRDKLSPAQGSKYSADQTAQLAHFSPHSSLPAAMTAAAAADHDEGPTVVVERNVERPTPIAAFVVASSSSS